MAPEKSKLSANIAARVDLIGGREQAHRGGHESACTLLREWRDHVDHGGALCEFSSFVLVFKRGWMRLALKRS